VAALASQISRLLPSLQWMSAPTSPAYSAGRRDGIEATLEARASGGDKNALEALLREHARAIHDVCRFVAGQSDAKDATQAALERVVKSIDKFDPDRGTFRTWALTVTRNVCRDRLRRRGLERRTFVADGDEVTSWQASEAPGPERVALAPLRQRGLMTLRLVHMTRPETQDFEWESFWASFTFRLR